MNEPRTFVLINPNQQLKIIFLVNILCFLAFATYPVILYFVFKGIQPDSYITSSLKEELFTKLLGFFLIFQVGFQLFLSYLFLFYTKRISKPVAHVADFLDSLVKGTEIETMKFQQDDFFQDLAPVFKVLKQKEENKRRVIKNVERELTKLLDQEDQEQRKNTLFFLKSEVSSLK